MGVPVFFLGTSLGFISNGDEGTWQLYTSCAALVWAGFVFAFTFPTARARWGRTNGAFASALTGIAASIVVFLASIVTLFVILIGSGSEG